MNEPFIKGGRPSPTQKALLNGIWPSEMFWDNWEIPNHMEVKYWINYYISLDWMPWTVISFLAWSLINNHCLDILSMLDD